MKETLHNICLTVLLVFLVSSRTISAQTKLVLDGEVCNEISQEPLSAASVILQSSTGHYEMTITDEKGLFLFKNLKRGEYTLHISYIGFDDLAKRVTLGSLPLHMKITLKPSATEIDEVVVTASESKELSSASKIDRTAMEHLQPTSFTDLLALIPGGFTKNPNMSRPNNISLREAGISSSDYNTSSLGTQFLVDGAPINTTADMQYVSSEITSSYSDKTSVNSGVDMRAIPTDNIESVEIVRGVPSVEYGDLTSGVVIIKRRMRDTPLEARFKADQYSKLISVGKGIEWEKKRAVLMFDGGFMDFKSDPRNPMENYKRANLSVRFQKRWELPSGQILSNRTAVDYSGNTDVDKNDPEILSQQEDKFKSTYQSGKLTNDFTWKYPAGSIFKSLDWKISASYSHDQIIRSRFVQLDRDRVAPNNMEAGVHDGEFLPAKYVAHQTVDGKPFNLFSNLKADFAAKTGIVRHTFFAGLSWSLSKNFGGGQMYDLNRPLNPLSGYSRPRSYYDIPASEQLSFFAQENLQFPIGRHNLEAQVGLRSNMLLNMDKEYDLHGKMYLDPRFNLQWNFPEIVKGYKKYKFSLAASCGWLTKMPTMLQLYPNKIYNDFVQLNYWHPNPEYRRFNTMTYIIDPANHHLRPARNFKWETRFNMDLDHNLVSFTYFRENMTSGFRSIPVYQPYTYRKYDRNRIDDSSLSAPPSLEGLPYEEKKVLDGYAKVGNGSRILKEGVEFQLSSRRFKAISSRLTVFGAWFRTTYENSEPIYKSVYEVIGDVVVGEKFVGLYESDDRYVRERFNTNFLFDTWISRLGLKLSVTLENMWFSSRKNAPVSGCPVSYMDTDGQIHPFTEEDKEDIYKKHLVLRYNEKYFDKEVEPFYMYVNFKATKDFGKHLSIALFADRILDCVPDYARYGKKIRRTAASPYFGMELNIKL